jgi:phenylalanyl-tRNA synthetase alpha chain
VSQTDLISRLDAQAADFAREAGAAASEQELRALQARYLGKKGSVSELMKTMGGLPPDGRRAVGEAMNRVKDGITAEVERRLAALADAERAADLARVVDVTVPGRVRPLGRLHILTQMREEIGAIFGELGFELAEGPEVDTDWNCFEALAIPADHPARDMQDTFYLEGEVLLRTHTSTVQIRTMTAQPPPVKIIAPGKVYRRDDDATHSPMFSQVEGLLVDREVSFADLKGVLMHFVARLFRKDLQIRFRPSYFPFVEPGAEVDMQCAFCMTGEAGCRVCKATGWVEIGGAGMVDPDVFTAVGYDPEAWTGFAFGMGIERMAMLRHGVNDIKYYYEGDLRFLRQF